ncbi:hypothetical protein D3C84_1010260 [compost metagenome]
MAARTKEDAYAPFNQEVIGTHQVIDGLHLMVDVLHAGMGGREQGDLVMDLVDTQQRRLANSVTDPGVCQLSPEQFITPGIHGAQANVAETGDTGITTREIASPAGMGTQDQFDVVATGILEANEVVDIAHFSVCT